MESIISTARHRQSIEITLLRARYAGISLLTIRCVVNKFQTDWNTITEDSYIARIRDLNGEVRTIEILDTTSGMMHQVLLSYWFVQVYPVNQEGDFKFVDECYGELLPYQYGKDRRFDAIWLEMRQIYQWLKDSKT